MGGMACAGWLRTPLRRQRQPVPGECISLSPLFCGERARVRGSLRPQRKFLPLTPTPLPALMKVRREVGVARGEGTPQPKSDRN